MPPGGWPSGMIRPQAESNATAASAARAFKRTGRRTGKVKKSLPLGLLVRILSQIKLNLGRNQTANSALIGFVEQPVGVS